MATGPGATTAGGLRPTQQFAWLLGAVAAGALAVRLVYVLLERRDWDPGGDAFFYHAGANLLADGKGFISPFHYEVGREVAAAEHPPLYLLYLAVPSLVGMDGVVAHLVWSCLAGAVTVVLVGLLGRAVAGDRIGITAAVIAAIYPNLWAPDGMLQAETLAALLATLAVLLAYWYLRQPSWQRVTAVAVTCGAGALARSELILLFPLLVVPLLLVTRTVGARPRLRWLGAAALSAALVIAPWVAFNATRFEHPVLLSSQVDPLLASANCRSTYYGDVQGYYDIGCATKVADEENIEDELDQSKQAIVFRRAAFDYIGDHVDRLPIVFGVRLLRIVGLYEPHQYVLTDSYVEGRELAVAWMGLISFYTVAALALVGAIVLRRQRVTVFPLLAPVAMVAITVVTTYASTRFRAAAEPSLVVLAAVSLGAAVRAISPALSRR